ncbi:MAG: Crp/Fnr family transcriptional regulator [Firmicutes bacterium]|nr:Crp/Fnr family transcriptional regulator [Bacillota bacterium]
MVLNQAELKKHLKEVDLFTFLTEDQFNQLVAAAAQKKLAKNEVLFLEGDPGEAMFIILEGAVQVYTLSPEGKEKILAILGQGDLLGELSLLDGEPRSATAQALEPTRLAVIDRAQFERFIRENSEVALILLRDLAHRLRQTDAHLQDLVFKDIQSRLAKVLLDLAEDYGENTSQGVKIKLKLTHQQLANYVGSTRETVTRTLLAFQDAGYVGFDQRFLVITDPETLQQIADGEPK